MKGVNDLRMENIEEEVKKLRKQVKVLQIQKSKIEDNVKLLKKQVEDLLMERQGKISFKSTKPFNQLQSFTGKTPPPSSTSKKRASSEDQKLLLPKKAKFGFAVLFEDFNITKTIPTYERKMLQYIYSMADPSECIAQTETSLLTRSDFRYLGPGNNLEIETVSMVSSILTAGERSREGKRNWYFPARLLENQVLCFGQSDLGKKWADWDYYNRYMGQLDECNEIFIPVLQNSHFILCRILLEDQKVEVWDSNVNYNDPILYRNKIYPILRAMDYVLAEQIKFYPGEISFGSFKLIRAKDVPRQPNDYDCGVFVILFMMYGCNITSKSYAFNSENDRSYIALWIANSEHNKKRAQLLTAIGLSVQDQ